MDKVTRFKPFEPLLSDWSSPPIPVQIADFTPAEPKKIAKKEPERTASQEIKDEYVAGDPLRDYKSLIG